MAWSKRDRTAGPSRQWRARPAQVLALVVVAGMCGEDVRAATDEVPRAYVEETRVEVVLNEPVIVTVVVANVTDRPWSVDWGGARNKNVWITAAHSGEEGTGELFVDMSPEEKNVTFGGPVELAPGEESRRQLVLDSWFDFTAVGSFEVVVGVPVSGRKGSEEARVTASVTVQIAPPDRELLAQACEALAEQAIKGASEPAHLAGEALSRTGDKECLPAILRVLDRSFFAKVEAIEGLAEIGSEEAIEALVARWEDLRPGLRARAMYEFQRRNRLEELENQLAEAQGPTTEEDCEPPEVPRMVAGSVGVTEGLRRSILREGIRTSRKASFRERHIPITIGSLVASRLRVISCGPTSQSTPTSSVTESQSSARRNSDGWTTLGRRRPGKATAGSSRDGGPVRRCSDLLESCGLAEGQRSDPELST